MTALRIVLALFWLVTLVVFATCAGLIWFIVTPIAALDALLRWAGRREAA